MERSSCTRRFLPQSFLKVGGATRPSASSCAGLAPWQEAAKALPPRLLTSTRTQRITHDLARGRHVHR